ncbi:MAG: TRAP transporter small permease subunit [Gammaproteobacteria bacterium]|nr:TRAP transporter small permease subunit [Gammaproteobacteria bacterium]
MPGILPVLKGVNTAIGSVVCWISLLMVLLQFSIVILRYVYGISFVFLTEGVLYMHASLFMLGAGYTLLKDEHVRVDIFYAKLSDRGRSITNICGALFFLIPSSIVIFWVSFPSVRNSWKIFEGAISVGGIPASFLLKTLIPLFCVTLIIEAIANVIEESARLKSK